MSALVKEQLEKLLPDEEQRIAAASRLVDRMDRARDLGVMGNVTWTREDLYDRNER